MNLLLGPAVEPALLAARTPEDHDRGCTGAEPVRGFGEAASAIPRKGSTA